MAETTKRTIVFELKANDQASGVVAQAGQRIRSAMREVESASSRPGRWGAFDREMAALENASGPAARQRREGFGRWAEPTAAAESVAPGGLRGLRGALGSSRMIRGIMGGGLIGYGASEFNELTKKAEAFGVALSKGDGSARQMAGELLTSIPIAGQLAEGLNRIGSILNGDAAYVAKVKEEAIAVEKAIAGWNSLQKISSEYIASTEQGIRKIRQEWELIGKSGPALANAKSAQDRANEIQAIRDRFNKQRDAAGAAFGAASGGLAGTGAGGYSYMSVDAQNMQAMLSRKLQSDRKKMAEAERREEEAATAKQWKQRNADTLKLGGELVSAWGVIYGKVKSAVGKGMEQAGEEMKKQAAEQEKWLQEEEVKQYRLASEGPKRLLEQRIGLAESMGEDGRRQAEEIRRQLRYTETEKQLRDLANEQSAPAEVRAQAAALAAGLPEQQRREAAQAAMARRGPLNVYAGMQEGKGFTGTYENIAAETRKADEALNYQKDTAAAAKENAEFARKLFELLAQHYGTNAPPVGTI